MMRSKKLAAFVGLMLSTGAVLGSGAPSAHASGSPLYIPTVWVNGPAAGDTTIAVNQGSILSKQMLSVVGDGITTACTYHGATIYGYYWTCEGPIQKMYITTGSGNDHIGVANVAATVNANAGADTVNVFDSPASKDTVDCGQYDHAQDTIFKDSKDTLTHCSSGGDIVHPYAPPVALP
jgi:hypothetical protein